MTMLLLGAGPSSPSSSPIPTSGLRLWFGGKLAQCYRDNPPTVPCALTDYVGFEASLGVGLPNAINGNPLSDGPYPPDEGGPTIQSDGLSCANVGPFNVWEGLAGAVDVPLTGDFTAYAAGTLASGDKFLPFGTGYLKSSAAVILKHNDNNLYFSTDPTGNFVLRAFGTLAGLVLIRVRRASSLVYFTWTGVAEDAGQARSGTATISASGAELTNNIFSSPSSRYLSRILYDRNIVPGSAEDLQIRAYILSVDGASL